MKSVKFFGHISVLEHVFRCDENAHLINTDQ